MNTWWQWKVNLYEQKGCSKIKALENFWRVFVAATISSQPYKFMLHLLAHSLANEPKVPLT